MTEEINRQNLYYGTTVIISTKQTLIDEIEASFALKGQNTLDL